MNGNLRTASIIALALIVFHAAGCRKEQENISGMSQEEKARYAVGLHLGKDADRQETIALNSTEEKVSYAIGLVIGRDFDRQELDLDPELLARGFQDAYSGKAPALNDEEIAQVREAFRSQRSAAPER
jgi:FKBP-type peptidyl-prolyl cis-trans isomerase FklB